MKTSPFKISDMDANDFIFQVHERTVRRAALVVREALGVILNQEKFL